MSNAIKSISIKGYKSIRDMDIELRNLNVLIGANGAGKSNFASFFRLLHKIAERKLQSAVGVGGGADMVLHFGPKVTKQIWAKIWFGLCLYELRLAPTVDNRLMFTHEFAEYQLPGECPYPEDMGMGHFESRLKDYVDATEGECHAGESHHVYEAMLKVVVYHVHDTSSLAGMRPTRADQRQ